MPINSNCHYIISPIYDKYISRPYKSIANKIIIKICNVLKIHRIHLDKEF